MSNKISVMTVQVYALVIFTLRHRRPTSFPGSPFLASIVAGNEVDRHHVGGRKQKISLFFDILKFNSKERFRGQRQRKVDDT